MPLPPPKGWATLQEKARRASDPAELANIIDEMNRLLTACEKAAGDYVRKLHPNKEKGSARPRTGSTKRR